MARLQRSCHRLIWLNPLIGTADYAPLTRGLQAALPFVDDFLPARTLGESRGPGGTLEHARHAVGADSLMDISGSYRFNAPPDRVWDLLMDPAVIASCIPGLRRASSPTAKTGIGRRSASRSRPSPAHTTARSRLGQSAATRLPPDGRRTGKAGIREGNVVDCAARRRRDTVVDVSGTVQTGGPIARLGQRLIGGVAKMMQDRFFACLQAKL